MHKCHVIRERAVTALGATHHLAATKTVHTNYFWILFHLRIFFREATDSVPRAVDTNEPLDVCSCAFHTTNNLSYLGHVV